MGSKLRFFQYFLRRFLFLRGQIMKRRARPEAPARENACDSGRGPAEAKGTLSSELVSSANSRQGFDAFALTPIHRHAAKEFSTSGFPLAYATTSLSKLTVLEAANSPSCSKEKWGVVCGCPMAMAAARGCGPQLPLQSKRPNSPFVLMAAGDK